LLIDAKSGDVFGKTVGFGGQTAKEYLEKLASFKNTPEGKAALEQEQKSAADRSSKSRVLGQKINDAIAAKDFKAAEASLEEMFADVSGPRKAVLPFNKARILIMIDPAAKEQALKYIDEALALTGGDETLASPSRPSVRRSPRALPRPRRPLLERSKPSAQQLIQRRREDFLRRLSFLAEFADRESGGAFGEPLAVGIDDERRVRPGRGRPAEGAVQQELTGGREEEVCATDDFGDAHGMVVGDHGEFVGGEAVFAPDKEVAEVASSHERLRALERIDKGDGLAVGHAEAPVGRAGSASFAAGTQGRAEAGRENRLGVILRVWGGQTAFDVLAGLVARIDRAGRLEERPDVAEPGKALRLHVGCVRAADVGSFGPFQPEPAQVFDRRIGELGSASSRIEIFGAVNQLPASGALGGESKGAGVANVQVAGGRRG
jgi:hypothetical protein